jgi:hypothetical protein
MCCVRPLRGLDVEVNKHTKADDEEYDEGCATGYRSDHGLT